MHITNKWLTNAECPSLLLSISDGNATVVYAYRDDKYLEGMSISYNCDAGYAFNSDDADYSCQSDGSWTNDNLSPQCVKSKLVNCFYLNEFIKLSINNLKINIFLQRTFSKLKKNYSELTFF